MFALHKSDEAIRIRDSKTGQESSFDPKTGEKQWGDLDLPAEEVLYKAWRQTQPPVSDVVLRKMFAKLRAGETG
jgi:hypothetical protein